MAKHSPLTDEEREKLVADLGGELDAQTARAVEMRISRDPRFRAEMEGLRRTWELLEFLPQAEPSPTFSSRTLSSISVLRPSPRPRFLRDPTLRRWSVGLAWVAAILIAFILGFSGVQSLAKRN